MKRREFIAGLGGAAAIVGPSKVFAQKTGEMPRVAVVGIDRDQKVVEAFDRGMRAAGWINDANARVDYRWSGSDPQLGPAVVTEVVSSNPSVIVSIGSPNTIALQRRTSTIPIVFAVVSDPVYQGIVTSFAHPGSNVTGFSYFDTGVGGKWLQVLREIAPQRTQFVSMFSPTNSPGKFFLRSIEDAARALDVEVLRMPVQNDDEILGPSSSLQVQQLSLFFFPLTHSPSSAAL
jgi:putative tryptophan/tyrosine transport system substrate-binding protein